MGELLQYLLLGHIGRGGHALLLSATLGESAAAKYFGRKTPQALDRTIERPYPSITTRRGEIAIPYGGRSKNVAVELSPILTDVAALLPAIREALAGGARVLLVCNTVTRANGLLRAVEAFPDIRPEWLFAVNAVVCPHHGRFAREDRELLDAAITARFGKDSAPGPLLLIGTQTLEQSLDIDADWLITDLCPMDVLLQRIGRLHRHERVRPEGFHEPRVTVRVPDKPLIEYLGHDGQLRAPAGLGAVYDDGRILQRTLDVLKEKPRLTIPADNRWLIEATTHPEALEQLGQAWQAHTNWLEGDRLADLRAATTAVISDQPFGELHYADKSERIATRLGEPSWELPLQEPMTSPFGARLTRLPVPAHLAPKEMQPPVPVAPQACEGGLRFTWQVTYRYTRFGLEKDNV
jgi:CRISPR-associated endonuclease/helicase Cas3